MLGSLNLRKIVLCAAFAALIATPVVAAGTYGKNPPDLERHLKSLVAAYPDAIRGYDAEALVLTDGGRLPLSDGREDKSFEELLNKPDIGDMFAFAYPGGAKPAQPALNFDPGRIRVQPLFDALYGDCKNGQSALKMRSIAWVPGHGGGKVSVTSRQGLDKALEAVSRDLDKLPASFTKYLNPPAGSYNCRTIAGTNRKSMHAYAAAIDINTKYSAYWQWAKPGSNGLHKWTNQIPVEVVDVFEKHGFIWGGRWYHYDTMHFEYRPDLLGPQN
jgi:hypothetical protein